MPAQDIAKLGYNIAEFDKQTQHVLSQMNSVIQAIEKIDSTVIGMGNFSGGIKDFKTQAEALKKAQDELAKSTNDYNKTLIQQSKAAETAAKASKAQTQAESELIKQKKTQLTYEQALEREKKKGLSQAQAEKKIADQLTNEYYQLGQALKDAENRYKALYLVAGKDNPATKAALQEALSTRKVLDDIDQSLGNYQRNVGNYASSFNGLNVSVQQILREAPSTANSLNTFFLAISNNLPMLFDEIQKANAGLKELKAAAAVANAELAAQTKIQQEAAIAANESSVALNTQVEALLANSAASAEQIAVIEKQLQEQVALSVANNESAEAIALQTEELLVNAGVAAEDAASLKLLVAENSKLAAASLRSTTALEAQAVATKEANAAASAQPSVFKRITSALFSWNTALTLGVLALTLFGGKIVELAKSLFNVGESFDKFKKSQETLNKSLEEGNSEYADAVKNVNELRINIDLAKEGFLRKDDVVKQYNETIGKTTGEVKNLEQAEKALQANADNYIKFTLYKAAAQQAFNEASKIAVDRQKQINDEINDRDFTQEGYEKALANSKEFNDQLKINLDQLAKTGTVTEENNRKLEDIKRTVREGLLAPDLKKDENAMIDIGKRFQELAAKIAKDNNFNFFDPDKEKNNAKDAVDVAFEFAKNELERQIKELQEFVDNGMILFDERNLAASALTKKQIELSNLVLNHEIKNDKARILAEQEAAVRIEDINKQLVNNIDKIFKESKLNLFKSENILPPIDVQRIAQPAIDGFKMINEAILKNLKDTAEKGANIFNIAFEQERFELAEQYNQGLISREKYEKGLADLVKKYSKESLELAIEKGEERIKRLDKESDAYKELAKAIADAKRTLDQFSTGLSFTEILDAVAASIANLTQALSTLNNIGYDNQIAKLEELGAQQQKNYEQEVRNIENSTLSEEEKANKLTILEKQRAAEQSEIDRKQKQAEAEKARFDKNLAIMNILLNTAQAITKALTAGPILGPILAVSIGALGAAQLAAAVATEIPSYEVGTDSAKEGWALTDEKGAELYVEPSGDMYMGNDNPTFRYLKAGTKVVPNDEVNEFLYKAMLRNTGLKMQNIKQKNEQVIDVKELGREITNSLKKQKRPYVKVINSLGNDFSQLNYLKRNLL